jgi:hypothetical protein
MITNLTVYNLLYFDKKIIKTNTQIPNEEQPKKRDKGAKEAIS